MSQQAHWQPGWHLSHASQHPSQAREGGSGTDLPTRARTRVNFSPQTSYHKTPRRTWHSTHADIGQNPTQSTPIPRFTRHKYRQTKQKNPKHHISPTSRFAHSCTLRTPQTHKNPKLNQIRFALCAP